MFVHDKTYWRKEYIAADIISPKVTLRKSLASCINIYSYIVNGGEGKCITGNNQTDR